MIDYINRLNKIHVDLLGNAVCGISLLIGGIFLCILSYMLEKNIILLVLGTSIMFLSSLYTLREFWKLERELLTQRNNILLSLEKLRLYQKDQVLLQALREIDFTDEREGRTKTLREALMKDITTIEGLAAMNVILQCKGYTNYVKNDEQGNTTEDTE